MMKLFLPRYILFAFLAALPSLANAQALKIRAIEPPNWWTGMETNQVQLMISGENLSRVTAQFHSPQIRVVRTYRTANPAYAFVDVEIDPNALDGLYLLTLAGPTDTATVNYPILRRKDPEGKHLGFDAADVIYLITPDRFANGDTTNDSVQGMAEAANPTAMLGRHGGDIKGIINRLDYIADLGVTALWINPLVENNNPSMSYHGYAATDLYRIDPRFGTNQMYELLVHEAHRRGLKVIMDHVSNHISSRHPWMRNLPMPDWINGTTARHARTMHYKAELLDPHSDSTTRENTTRGWFADYMPDLNQTNPFVRRYLIQSTIWWIEWSGIDGIREDTYPYADPQYLAAWTRAIMNEYPKFNIVGEVWIDDPVFVAPFQKGSPVQSSFDTNLPSVTDFGLFNAFMQVFGSGAGIRTIYECLQKDFLYGDPSNLVTFLDNHDVRRIFHVTQGNAAQAKMALTMLFTLRGIPELLYGTEIGLEGGKDHGVIRSDFPGGFPRDKHNAFSERGRTPHEAAIFTFVRKLLHIRREHPALAYGKLIHFPPSNEAYIYFREQGDDRIMVVANNLDAPQRVNLAGVRHRLGGARTLQDLITGNSIDLSSAMEVTVPGKSAMVLSVGTGR